MIRLATWPEITPITIAANMRVPTPERLSRPIPSGLPTYPKAMTAAPTNMMADAMLRPLLIGLSASVSPDRAFTM